jgi:glycosidase
MQQGNRYVFEEARLPMKWDAEANPDLITFFRRLGNLRRENPVLAHGKRSLLHLDEAARTYAYLRHDGQRRMVTAVNLAPESRSLSIAGTGLRSAVDLLNGNPVEARDGMLTVRLPPRGGALIA